MRMDRWYRSPDGSAILDRIDALHRVVVGGCRGIRRRPVGQGPTTVRVTCLARTSYFRREATRVSRTRRPAPGSRNGEYRHPDTPDPGTGLRHPRQTEGPGDSTRPCRNAAA